MNNRSSNLHYARATLARIVQHLADVYEKIDDGHRTTALTALEKAEDAALSAQHAVDDLIEELSQE